MSSFPRSITQIGSEFELVHVKRVYNGLDQVLSSVVPLQYGSVLIFVGPFQAHISNRNRSLCRARQVVYK